MAEQIVEGLSWNIEQPFKQKRTKEITRLC